MSWFLKNEQKNLPTFLPSVVEALNEKPLKKLGNFSPSEINNEKDNAKINVAQKREHI